MLKIMKQAKNRPLSLRVIYLLLLCSTHCWALSLEKWGKLRTPKTSFFTTLSHISFIIFNLTHNVAFKSLLQMDALYIVYDFRMAKRWMQKILVLKVFIPPEYRKSASIIFLIFFNNLFSLIDECMYRYQLSLTGGKSALLTALVVGLGGKAVDTNRAKSLKTFIKTDRPWVTCDFLFNKHTPYIIIV